MFKKGFISLLIITLCVALVLPFVNMGGKADAILIDMMINGVSKTLTYSAPTDTESEDYQTYKAIKDAGTNVVIEAQSSGTEYFEVYKNGVVSSSTDFFKANLVSFSYNSSNVAIEFVSKTTANGFRFKISTINEEEPSNVKSRTLTTKKVTSEDEVKNSMHYFINDEALDKFDARFTAYTADLKKGDTFYESKFKTDDIQFSDLFRSYLLTYNQKGLKKTLHYAIPTGGWSTTTATGTSTFSFTLSYAGHYRVYITCQSDVLLGDDTRVEISDAGLEEVYDSTEERFYLAKVYVDATEVYAVKSGDKYVYYTDDTQETEVDSEGKAIAYDYVIPIFEFDVAQKDFAIEAPTSSQTQGYINSSYTMSGTFTTYGVDVETTYKLYYTSNDKVVAAGYTVDLADWAEATEELSSLTFTPTKKGYYIIQATAVDTNGATDVAFCSVISVQDEFKSIEYKTSFGDWLKVNTLPFIFLCISAACLIAILCLIFIKPKKKVVEVKEEDK